MMYFVGLCSSLYPILKLVKAFLRLLQIAVPIALIVFGSIDMAKAVIAGKDDEMKKAQGTLIKRFIYAVAVFLISTLVFFVMNLVAASEPAGIDGDPLDVNSWRSCWDCKSLNECKSVDVQKASMCYYSSSLGKYVWGDYSTNNDYVLVEKYNNKNDCLAKSACYWNKYNYSYYWGRFENDSNYQLVDKYTNEKDCLAQKNN